MQRTIQYGETAVQCRAEAGRLSLRADFASKSSATELARLLQAVPGMVFVRRFHHDDGWTVAGGGVAAEVFASLVTVLGSRR